MKKFYTTTLFLLLTSLLYGQQINLQLRSGEYSINRGYDLENNEDINYRYLFFDQLPNSQEKEGLNSLGISFLDYVSKNTFIISYKKQLDIAQLQSYGVIGVTLIDPITKLDFKLQDGKCPDWALNGINASVKVILHKNVEKNEVLFKIKEKYFLSDEESPSHVIYISLPVSKLEELAAYSFICFIEPIEPPSYPENKTARTLHRSNVLNTNFNTGRKYNGLGVKVMMQDDGYVGPHIDRQGRVDQSFCSGCTVSGSDHGDHVSGTIMGAGNIDPEARGMADGSFLYVYGSSNNNYYDVPMLYNSHDVTITSKSYSNGCNAGYTSLAQDLDAQVRDHDALIHVFSAGNNGSSSCSNPYIPGTSGVDWGNVTGGHKQAKNVIAVANLNSTSGLASSSSRGPAEDGRIKPDVGAKGSYVYSTEENQTYGTKSGTSMSCPGVSGVLAQLYQAYKELNSGQNPSSALMKAILLNTADDIGNPGPDFKYGWGEVNIYRAIKLLESGNYITNSLDQGNTNTHNIIVPAGTQEVKVMVYWHDKEASTSASTALVNNLNMQLTSPTGITYDPWVLDHTPNASNLNQNAVRGTDDLNNMEQVTIDIPAAGNYTLSINGSSVPYGPQSYYVVYEFISDHIELTYPIGGESIVPGENELIRWDTYNTSGSCIIDYSLDGGNNWINITNSAIATNRYYNWYVPNTVTDNAIVRISRNGITDQSDATFTIIDVPQNVIVDWVCPDSIYVYWNAVNGANSYEVNMLGQMYMDSMTTTSNLNTLIINPNPAITDSWFSVSAKLNNGKGRRAIAVNAQPTNNACLAPPIASFSSNTNNSCSGIINFYDNSFNQPNTWFWDFGDGNTSTQQNPTHIYSQQGSYNVSLLVSNGLGQDSSLQMGYINVTYTSPATTYNDTSCASPSTFTLGASSNSTNWYIDTLGSPSIHTGAIYNTPLLNTTTTYYVKEYGGPSIFGGALNNNIGNGSYFNNFQYLIFDCYKPSKIISYDVYAGTSQNITFELRDVSGSVIDDTTILVQLGLNTLYVDFDVPVGNDLQLGVSSTNTDLYRNSDGANYPYYLGNIASITGSSATTSTGYYYFFYNIQMKENCVTQFAPVTAHIIPGQATYSNQSVTICQGDSYNIGLNSYTVPGLYIDTIMNTNSCDSIVTTNLTVNPQQVVNNNVTICEGDIYVVGNNTYSTSGTYTNIFLDANGCDSIHITYLTVVDVSPVINQGGGVLQVSVFGGAAPYTYQWYPGGETTQSITPITNGLYWVTVTDANGCIDTSSIFLNDVPSSVIYISSDISIYPNPTNGKVNLNFPEYIAGDIDINIINEMGQKFIISNMHIEGDAYNRQIDLTEFAKGIYFLEIITEGNVYQYKLTLQ